jgi:hypothetical protein
MATKTANLAQLSNTFDVNSSGAVSVGGSTGTSGQVLTSQGSGAAPQWGNGPGLTLLATLTPTNGATSVSTTGLAISKSLIIITDGIELTTFGILNLNISSDNGSSYSTQNITFAGSSTTPGGFIQLFRTDTSSSNKPYFVAGSFGYGAITDVTGVVNALRITTGATFNGVGKIYVYGLN